MSFPDARFVALSLRSWRPPCILIYSPFMRHSHPVSGRPGLLGLTRRIIWAWWFWVAIAIAAGMYEYQKTAIAFTGVALLTYLMAAREHPPEQGLEVQFPVRSHEFVDSMVGATGVQFLRDNKITVLNNGDEFYPSMLEAIEGA